MSRDARRALERAEAPIGPASQGAAALVGIGYAIVSLAEAATRIADAFEAARKDKR